MIEPKDGAASEPALKAPHEVRPEAEQRDTAGVHPAPTRGKPPVRATEESGIAEVLASAETVDEILHPEEIARFANDLKDIPVEARESVKALLEEKNIAAKDVAKMLAEQGVPEGKVLKFLETTYGIDRDEARKITASDELRTKFDANNVEPATETPEEQQMRHDMEQAIEQDFGPAAERAIGMPAGEERDAAIEDIKARFVDRFGDGAKNAAGKLLKFSSIGSFAFILIFVLLLSVHSPNK